MAAREGERFWRGASDAQKADGAEFWQELMRERRRRQAESAQESACEPERETVPVEWIAHDVLLKVRNGLTQSRNLPTEFFSLHIFQHDVVLKRCGLVYQVRMG